MKTDSRNIVLIALALAALSAVPFAARRAYCLSPLGVILNFVFPPSDLFNPIAQSNVTKDVRAFDFTVKHKYPGNYGVTLTIPRHKENIRLKGDPTVTVEFSWHGVILLRRSARPVEFWARKRQGWLFYLYKFPNDIVRGPIACRVLIDGNIDALLNRSNDVVVAVTKLSDE